MIRSSHLTLDNFLVWLSWVWLFSKQSPRLEIVWFEMFVRIGNLIIGRGKRERSSAIIPGVATSPSITRLSCVKQEFEYLPKPMYNFTRQEGSHTKVINVVRKAQPVRRITSFRQQWQPVSLFFVSFSPSILHPWSKRMISRGIKDDSFVFRLVGVALMARFARSDHLHSRWHRYRPRPVGLERGPSQKTQLTSKLERRRSLVCKRIREKIRSLVGGGGREGIEKAPSPAGGQSCFSLVANLCAQHSRRTYSIH